MIKKLAWHIELALLRRRMRRLNDSPANVPTDEDLLTTLPQQLSGFVPFRDTTSFTDLH